MTNFVTTKPNNIREVMVYDIPVTAPEELILEQIEKSWGKVIFISCKKQRKYQSVLVKIEFNDFTLGVFENGTWVSSLGNIPVRWYPASWSLKQRKEREKFQTAILDIPPSMTLQALWTQGQQLQFLNGVQGLKAFKLVQDAKGKRKLVGFFETWESLHKALESKPVWEEVTLSW